MMKIIKILAALVGLTLVFIFCSSNDTKVTLNFLDYSTPETYLFLYVLSAFVLGMIVASFSSTVKIMQLKRKLSKLQPEGDTAPVKEKKKKGQKGEKQKGESETPSCVDNKQPTQEDVIVPPVVETTTPEAEADDDKISDAIFEDESVAGTTPEEAAVSPVIELPHDSADDDVTESETADKK